MPGLVAGAAVEGHDGVGGHPAFVASVGWGLVAAFCFCPRRVDCAHLDQGNRASCCVARGRRRGPRGALGARCLFAQDCPRVSMIVEVEPVCWVEVKGGFVDSIEVVDWGVEVFL